MVSGRLLVLLSRVLVSVWRTAPAPASWLWQFAPFAVARSTSAKHRQDGAYVHTSNSNALRHEHLDHGGLPTSVRPASRVTILLKGEVIHEHPMLSLHAKLAALRMQSDVNEGGSKG